MDVKSLKALVFMCQHEVDGALGECGVGLAILTQLDLLQKDSTCSTSALAQHHVPQAVCSGCSLKHRVASSYILTSSDVNMTQWAACGCYNGSRAAGHMGTHVYIGVESMVLWRHRVDTQYHSTVSNWSAIFTLTLLRSQHASSLASSPCLPYPLVNPL